MAMFQEQLRTLLEQPKNLILWVFILSVMPFLHWFGIVLMTLVTLRKGWREGLILCVVAVLASLLLSLMLGAQISKLQTVWQFINIFGIWLMATALNQTGSWNNVLKTTIVIGAVVVLITHAFFPSVIDYWEKAFLGIASSPDHIPEFLSSELTPQQIQAYAGRLADMIVGMQASLILFFGVLSLMIARYVQATLYNPNGLKPELYNLRLGAPTGVILMILLALALITKQAVLIDLAPVLAVPGFFLGMSLAYFLSAQSKYQLAILIGLYILLVLFFPYSFQIIVIAGLFDTVFDFRKRFLLTK